MPTPLASPPMRSDVEAVVEVNGIFRDSPIEVTAWSAESFVLTFAHDVLETLTGTQVDEGVKSAGDGSRETLKVLLGGALTETWVLESGPRNEFQQRYGLRWFPFVSSRLDLTIRSDDARLRRVALKLPATTRRRWRHPIDVRGDDEPAPAAHHSFSSNAWSYYAVFENAVRNVSVRAALQTAASEISRMVIATTYTWMLASLAVVAAAALATRYVTAALVGAFGALLVQEWRRADRSHHLDPLSILYLIAGFCLTAWAVSWEVAGLWAALGLLALSPIWLGTLLSVAYFEANGHLPLSLARRLRAVLGFLETSRARVRRGLMWKFFLRGMNAPLSASLGDGPTLTVSTASPSGSRARLEVTYDPAQQEWVLRKFSDDLELSALELKRPGRLPHPDELDELTHRLAPRDESIRPTLAEFAALAKKNSGETTNDALSTRGSPPRSHPARPPG